MIREHTFNSRWWGEPVGVVVDAAFFAEPAERRRALLAPYAWAEFQASADRAPPAPALRDAGFFHVDTQINFRINLRQVADAPSLAALSAARASERPFAVPADGLKPFEHERFHALPGATQARIDARYAAWSAELIAGSADLCLEIASAGVVQGWFLAQRRSGQGFNLTLAMLSRDASVSGMLLYQKACRTYAEQGERIGFAAFSATNTAVHNIYAALGARFVAPTDCWLWSPA